MLRVMKRKLQQEETTPEGGIGLSRERNTTEKEMPPSGTTRIVSHVPVSSRTSVSSLSSDNSSLSSAQYHPFQSLSRQDDEQTHDGEPPVLKATITVGGEGLLFLRSESHASASTSTEEAKVVEIKPLPIAAPQQQQHHHQHGFTRTISFVSGDIAEAASAKRARIETSWSSWSHKAADPRLPTRLLLATAKDSFVLSPLHIFVRQQIEVFEASEGDLKQPAPGRRIPIQLNQVGLRCIHCKHQKARERKKRAVCYPSSVGRVYHSVSDMKFAHFPCQQMPKELQERFAELKDELQNKLYKDSGSKRIGSANASTAQYYHDSACELGMVDGKGGIFATEGLLCGPVASSAALVEGVRPLAPSPRADPSLTLAAISQANALQGMLLGNFLPTVAYASTAAVAAQDQGNPTRALKNAQATAAAPAGSTVVMTSAKPMPTLAVVPSVVHNHDTPMAVAPKPPSPPTAQGTTILLSSEMDKQYLTPIHCFVRRHVEVFAANEQDLAAPAPGRKKPIVLGQVGLRCVHCARLPVKERVKRAICFPPATSGIYHALSNMKFDHFKHCKGIPKEAREEFQQLSSSLSSSSTGGKRSSSRPRVSNSTAQYYHDSALRIGLYDTPDGIRIRQQPSIPGSVVAGKGDDVPEGMEALIIAATDPKIRAAHEERKASPVGGQSA